MTFQNYNTKNDAISTLLAWISASATSVQVQSTDGAKFPTGNFIVTLIQYTNKLDRTSAIVKKEKVLVSTNATDTFTITRGFWGDTPTAFETGDTIVLNVVSEVIEDVQDEVIQLRTDFTAADTSLNNAKLNKWALRTGLAGVWKMFFSNGSNNEVELAIGSAWYVLQSNGAASNPSWEVPTVNINSLSESASPISSWFGIFYNGSSNVKVLLSNLYKATTNIPWTSTTIWTISFWPVTWTQVQKYTPDRLWSVQVDYSYSVGAGSNKDITIAVGIGEDIWIDGVYWVDTGTFLRRIRDSLSSSGGTKTGTFYIPTFPNVPINFTFYAEQFGYATFVVKKGN